MSIKKGSTAIVDRNKGSQLVGRVYKGSNLIFDAYTEVTGNLPLSFNARADHNLKNYRVYGTAAGAGAQTVNLFPVLTSTTSGRYLKADGTMNAVGYWITTDFVPVSGRVFTLTHVTSNLTYAALCAYNANKNLIKGQEYGTISEEPYNVTIECESDVSYIRFCYYTKATAKRDIMLISGTEQDVPSSFVPYGYEIPLALTNGPRSVSYHLYLGGNQLMDEEYLDYAEQKIYKMVEGILTPTGPPSTNPLPAITAYQGENTLSSTETVGNVTVKGRIAFKSSAMYLSPQQGGYSGSVGSSAALIPSNDPYYGYRVGNLDLMDIPAGHQLTIKAKTGFDFYCRVVDPSTNIVSEIPTNFNVGGDIVIPAKNSDYSIGLTACWSYPDSNSRAITPSDVGTIQMILERA